MDEGLRKDIASIAAKFPEGSKAKYKGKTVDVLGNGKDYVKIAMGRKTMEVKPSDLVAESTKEYGKTVQRVLDKRKMAQISKGDKLTLAKLDAMMKKLTKEELAEGYTLPRKDFEKLKKGDIVNVEFDSSIKKGLKYKLQVKSRSRSAKYNVDKVTMMDASDSRNRTKFILYSRDGKDATLGWGDMGVTMVKFAKEATENKDLPIMNEQSRISFKSYTEAKKPSDDDMIDVMGPAKNSKEAVKLIQKKFKMSPKQAEAEVKRLLKKLLGEEVTEKVDRANSEGRGKGYTATHEKGSKGYRAVLKDPKGKEVYMGSRSYKTKEAAEGEAEAYKQGYFSHPQKATNDRGATNAVHKYRQSVKESLDEKMDKEKYKAQKSKTQKKSFSSMRDRLADELEEKKMNGKSATGYDIYHDTYSAAMQHAYAHAKKKHGVTVRPSEIDDKVATGPRKPSSGKTVSHILKTDKKQNLHVQVYNTGRKYELNMYVESVEVDEANLRKMDHDEFMKYGDNNPRGRADPAWNAERKRRYKNSQASMYRKMKKEEVELEESTFMITVPKGGPGGKDLNMKVMGKDQKSVVAKWRKENPKFKNDTINVKQLATLKKKGDKYSFSKESLEENAVQLARDVVKSKSAMKGLDMQTANAILTVYDKVNDANKKKMETMPINKLGVVVWKIVGAAGK